MPDNLLPCPFCGANPHSGLGPKQVNQLHGEELQPFRIWCPHKCAEQEHPAKSIAIKNWNARQQPLDDLFTSDDRLLYTEIAFAQHVRGTLKWHEGKTFAMARIERTIKRQTFAIVVKRDEPRTPGLLPAIRVYTVKEVGEMLARMTMDNDRTEFRELYWRVAEIN